MQFLALTLSLFLALPACALRTARPETVLARYTTGIMKVVTDAQSEVTQSAKRRELDLPTADATMAGLNRVTNVAERLERALTLYHVAATAEHRAEVAKLLIALEDEISKTFGKFPASFAITLTRLASRLAMAIDSIRSDTSLPQTRAVWN